MLKPLNHINVLFWCIILICPFLFQSVGIIDTNLYRISQENGIWSIVTGTFLHSSYNHLFSNLTGMLLGTSILYNLQRKMYGWIIVLGIIIPSTVMYCLDTPTVGSSGLLFTILWYLIIRGLMSTDKYRFYVAIILLILYGASLQSTVPQSSMFKLGPQIAWQAHLTGVILGFILAVIQRLKRD